MTMTKKIYIILLGFAIPLFTNAQEAETAAGGNITGSSGSVSYTLGQMDYTSIIGSAGIITQGVQQPFDILVVNDIKEAKDIYLKCSVFPNPANEFINLRIESYNIENLSFQLYDINGKLLENKKIESNETSISMKNLVQATYFLKVTDNNKEIKTFKIIKN